MSNEEKEITNEIFDYIGDKGEDYWEAPIKEAAGNMANAFNNSQAQGLTIVSDPVASETGRVQIELAVDGEKSLQARSFTVTTTPSNPDSMNRVVVMAAGSSGWAHAEVNGYIDGHIDEYLLSEGDANYTVVRVQNTSTPQEVYDYVPYIADDLRNEFDKNNTGTPCRYTFAGASASASGVIKGAEAVLAYRKENNPDDHTPIDFMLLEAQDSAKNFVKDMNASEELKQEMIRTGSIIYAYEKQEAGNGSTKASEAVNNMGVLADSGMIIVEVENAGVNAHAHGEPTDISHELQLSNGEVGRVVNHFEGAEENGPAFIADKHGENQPNKYYLILPKPESETTWDYYKNRKEVTEKQLNAFGEYREIKGVQTEGKYLNDLIGYVESETEEKSGYVNLASGNAVQDDDILFKFQDIIDSANNIVTDINGTSYKNNGFDYQFCDGSTTDFPESLNRGNAYLYSITNSLLGSTAQETQNIEQILNDYMFLNKEYTSRAEDLMNHAYQRGTYFVEDSVEVKNAIDNKEGNQQMYGIFDQKIEKEHAGKISMSDIETMVSGNKLVGKLGEGLSNERDDAAKLKQAISDFLNCDQEGIVKGDAWDAEKERLEKWFITACDRRIEATQILESAYIKALKDVADYIRPDEYLDDGELEQLRNDLKAAKAVKEYRGTGQYIEHSDGTKEEIMEPNEPEYTDAQNLIKELDGADGKIAKLEGLAQVLTDANATVAAALEEVNSKYAACVDDIPELHLGSVMTM